MSVFDRWRVITITKTKDGLFDRRYVHLFGHMTHWGAERERNRLAKISSLECKENETHVIVRFL